MFDVACLLFFKFTHALQSNNVYYLPYIGECWGNLEKYHQTQYDKNGKSSQCINSRYQGLDINEKPTKCGIYMGKRITNYVYKISKYSST